VSARSGIVAALLLTAALSVAQTEVRPVEQVGKAQDEQQIGEMDRNDDGRITRAEAHADGDLLRRWSQLDRDADGHLTASEIGGTGGGSIAEPER
jgi:hypothetical protein